MTNQPNVDVKNEIGQEGINEDYVTSEGSFKDNEFQFNEEYKESEID